MKTIALAIAKAIDHHATELILAALCMPFLLAYWRTRDQLLGNLISILLGGVLAIATKRAMNTTNVGNVEQANITEKKE